MPYEHPAGFGERSCQGPIMASCCGLDFSGSKHRFIARKGLPHVRFDTTCTRRSADAGRADSRRWLSVRRRTSVGGRCDNYRLAPAGGSLHRQAAKQMCLGIELVPIYLFHFHLGFITWRAFQTLHCLRKHKQELLRHTPNEPNSPCITVKQETSARRKHPRFVDMPHLPTQPATIDLMVVRCRGGVGVGCVQRKTLVSFPLVQICHCCTKY